MHWRLGWWSKNYGIRVPAGRTVDMRSWRLGPFALMRWRIE